MRASVVSGVEVPTEKSEDKSFQLYFFEPSLEEVVIFFETEIFASLLEQVFHESRLAKTASRMMLLDRASQNIDKSFDRLFFQKQRN